MKRKLGNGYKNQLTICFFIHFLLLNQIINPMTSKITPKVVKITENSQHHLIPYITTPKDSISSSGKLALYFSVSEFNLSILSTKNIDDVKNNKTPRKMQVIPKETKNLLRVE